MDFYEIEDKSSPDSWSTCDMSSQQDLNATPAKEISEKCRILKQRKSIKSIFSTLKSFINPPTNDSTPIIDYINSTFNDESLENLSSKLNFKCCSLKKHSSGCMKKWKNVQDALISLAMDYSQEPKMIFSIKKRKSQGSKVLLDKSQPSWIHRLILQSLLDISSN
ncbi:hypothetical protein SteCoe_9077 [Stentor coeruleus]|uniref:Uncharacterized protein n=1 Tax=Stentor coeruleus TaxID=5963 RepID=A0A1R2CIK6_9CILI|nr:hypothetical protein SteCoe_9077 [Stentor coeruleus]